MTEFQIVYRIHKLVRWDMYEPTEFYYFDKEKADRKASFGPYIVVEELMRIE